MSVSRSIQNRRLLRPLMWGIIAGLLLLPVIAMPFTHEVKWGAEDFAFATLLLIGAGLLIELQAGH